MDTPKHVSSPLISFSSLCGQAGQLQTTAPTGQTYSTDQSNESHSSERMGDSVFTINHKEIGLKVWKALWSVTLQVRLDQTCLKKKNIENNAYENNASRSLEFVELIITSGTYKVCDSMPCTIRPAMLLFLSRCAPCLCNS